jgi:hypothetical protein
MCSPETLDRDLHMVSHNAQFITSSPAESMRMVRSAAIEMGAQVQNASASAQNANLNLRFTNAVDPTPLFRAIDGQLSHESTSSSDYRQHVEQQCDRLELLDVAHAELSRWAASGVRIEAAMLQRELNERERQNIKNQLRSYLTQAQNHTVNISFSRPQ